MFVIQYGSSGDDWLTFDHLTLVPIQLKMIERDLLSSEEIRWLNLYHCRVREVIGEEICRQGKGKDLFDWLIENTRSI